MSLHDQVSLGNALFALLATVTGCLAAYIGTRRALFGALKDEAAGWERLAGLRAAEIDSVGKRIATLELELDRIRRENGELRELNLSLQHENVRLQTEILLLTARVQKLEPMGKTDA